MNYKKTKNKHLKKFWVAEIVFATIVGALLFQITDFAGFMYLIYCYYFFIRVKPWIK